MERQSTRLRALLRAKTFLHMPSVYDAIGGRLVQSLGYEAAYIGGYVTGGSTAITEPLLSMTEQVGLAAAIAGSINIPLVADEIEAKTVEARQKQDEASTEKRK